MSSGWPVLRLFIFNPSMLYWDLKIYFGWDWDVHDACECASACLNNIQSPPKEAASRNDLGLVYVRMVLACMDRSLHWQWHVWKYVCGKSKVGELPVSITQWLLCVCMQNNVSLSLLVRFLLQTDHVWIHVYSISWLAGHQAACLCTGSFNLHQHPEDDIPRCMADQQQIYGIMSLIAN